MQVDIRMDVSVQSAKYLPDITAYWPIHLLDHVRGHFGSLAFLAAPHSFLTSFKRSYQPRFMFFISDVEDNC